METISDLQQLSLKNLYLSNSSNQLTRTIEYTITQGTGDQKFLVALIFKDILLSYKEQCTEEIDQIQIGECALVLVAN